MSFTLKKKIKIIISIKEKINNSKNIFVTNYYGLTGKEVTILRKQVLNLKYVFLKTLSNKIGRKIFLNSKHECLLDILNGPILIFFSNENQKIISSLLYKFNKKYNKLNVIGISLNQKMISGKELKNLAELPNIEQIIINIILIVKYLIIKFIYNIKIPNYNILNIFNYLKNR